MKFYWRKHFEEKFLQNRESFLKQVGKTINGKEIPWSQVDLIIKHIRKNLFLKETDIVVDLGCGNGILTRSLATNVKSIRGYDFSSLHIDEAKNLNKFSNVWYELLDINKLKPHHTDDANIIILFEVLQHMNKCEFNSLLEKLYINSCSKSKIFIGGIPDRRLIRSFYNTNKKYDFYLKSLEEDKPHLGTWWDKKDLINLAKKTGWKAKFIDQPELLYSSYYRFDLLLTKLT